MYQQMRDRLQAELGKLQRPAERTQKGTLQQRALKMLAVFFALMLLFTVVSRAADSMTVPQVRAQTAGSGMLKFEIEAQGQVRALGEQTLAVPQGLTVESVPVKQGDAVQAGDTLLTVDLDQLKDRLARAKNELADLQLQAEKEQLPDGPTGNSELDAAYAALRSARQEYRDIEETQDTLVARAREDYEAAKAEYERLKALCEAQGTPAGERELPPAPADPAQGPGDGEPGGPAEGMPDGQAAAQQTVTEEEVAAAAAAMRQAERTLEDARDARQRQLESAERAVKSARSAVNSAEERAKYNEEAAALEDRRAAVRVQALQLEMEAKREEIAALSQLVQAGGALTAPEDGVVTQLNAAPGAVAAGRGDVGLSSSEQGYEFRAPLDQRTAERLQTGDEAYLEVTADGRRQQVKGEVVSVGTPDEKEQCEVVVRLPQGSYRSGESAQLRLEKYSGTYYATLPLTALRSDNGGDFVYILQERNTVLGAQTVVARVPVRVLDRDAKTAAVEGAFQADDRIVTASSKALEPQDRVRVEMA